jgi:4-hydroxy-3-polyprenylbenzoate decarboxylase
MQNFINTLKKQNLITIIKEELDIKLEIPHLAFLEAKKEGGGKALTLRRQLRNRLAG